MQDRGGFDQGRTLRRTDTTDTTAAPYATGLSFYTTFPGFWEQTATAYHQFFVQH